MKCNVNEEIILLLKPYFFLQNELTNFIEYLSIFQQESFFCLLQFEVLSLNLQSKLHY